MIRFRNGLREMKTYEIPMGLGLGVVRQKVGVLRRSIGPSVAGQQGVPVDLNLEINEDRRFPQSFTLTAAGTRGDVYPPMNEPGLPDDLARAEPFKGLLARRALILIRVPEEPPAPAPEEAAPPPPSAVDESSQAAGGAPSHAAIEHAAPAKQATSAPEPGAPHHPASGAAAEPEPQAKPKPSGGRRG